jgi:co-chaperonin GroES (HSP10)
MQAPGPTKVIVEQSPMQTHVGGLEIPECARVKPMDGIVRAVGSEVLEPKLNDKVLVQWQHGNTETFSYGGKMYWKLDQKQVLAVIG